MIQCVEIQNSALPFTMAVIGGHMEVVKFLTLEIHCQTNK